MSEVQWHLWEAFLGVYGTYKYKKYKIRRATGPRRVRSRKSFISLFLVLEIAYSARKGGSLGALSSTNDPPFTAKSLQSRPWSDFYWFLDDPKRHQKINDFSNHQKSSKIVESIDPGAPRISFWTKKHNFWDPFWHWFFDFFRKWQKCKISEEYNAKRGSEPSKSFDFHIDFTSNVHVFSKPPSGDHFWF